MRLNLWDQEFSELDQKISQISEGFGDDSGSKLKELVNKDLIVRKLESYLNNTHLRFKRMCEATIAASSKLKAVIYWSTELSTQCRNLLDDYDQYLKQNMWIQLFKSRFLGKIEDDRSYLLSDEELIRLQESHFNLKRMAEFLEEQNKKLSAAERELRQTYDELTTEEENFIAGQSMQKQWGIGAVRAQKNPCINEVAKILYGIGFKTSSRVQEATQLKMMSHDFNARSKQIMDDCRTLMEQNDSLREGGFNSQKVQSIKHSLNDMRQLESRLSHLAFRAMPASRNPSPILLKKTTNRGTTGAESFK